MVCLCVGLITIMITTIQKVVNEHQGQSGFSIHIRSRESSIHDLLLNEQTSLLIYLSSRSQNQQNQIWLRNKTFEKEGA